MSTSVVTTQNVRSATPTKSKNKFLIFTVVMSRPQTALLAAFADEAEGFCKVDQVNLVDPVEVVDLSHEFMFAECMQLHHSQRSKSMSWPDLELPRG